MEERREEEFSEEKKDIPKKFQKGAAQEKFLRGIRACSLKKKTDKRRKREEE